jgi:murein DD-endopeptidase MepM/ murein hydrolase activator NlpD
MRPGSALVLLGIAAFCCGCRPAPAPVRSLVHRSDVLLPRETETIEAVVPPHATLESLLRQHQLRSDLVDRVIQAAGAVFNPRQLRAERPYRLVLSMDGFLREFEYQIDTDRFLRIVRRKGGAPDQLDASVLPYEKDTQLVAVHGAIDAGHVSLISAIEGAGENVQFAIALADIFSGEIDFQSDLQPGDTFAALFEKSTREGQFAGYGAILCARVTNDGRDHVALRWINPDTTRAGYYDENGRSLKRFMLKSPLKFDPRITSGFSRRRLHPLLGTYRAHLGIDYGAPIGAPVVAVANGVVLSAGWAGGGGNQIRIRHADGYESFYLHLSSFAVRTGARVAQGQLIGRVGSTGTATGPHLDYRLRKNGVFVNPLVEHRRLPPGEPIPRLQLASFASARDDLLRRMTTGRAADASTRKPDAVAADR